MLFTSLMFLFVFLPSLLLVYYVIPKRLRNNLLLLYSFLFYAWGGVSYSIILLGSVGFNYLFIKQIEKQNEHRKTWLISGLTFNVLLIVVFKYLDFIIGNVNVLGEAFFTEYQNIKFFKIVLPLGISFFTFQQMSLLWDVYRDKETPKVRLTDIALYISLFPQLIAGPIVRYKDIIKQINWRDESFELFKSGIRKFIIGLFKKLIIANSCASIADQIIDAPIDSINTPIAWMGILSYTFQIYFDFSGYSYMAIGLGRMFGFKIHENFNFPYISTSIKEFWRRWHISLSTWFRDYLYIPLGGNRVSKTRTYVNLLLVFLLTGFWHGATWSFIFWGLFHGTFLLLEKAGLDRVLHKAPKPLSWLYMMLVVIIGWVFFRIESFDSAFAFCKLLFGLNQSSTAHFINYLSYENIAILTLAILSSTTFFLIVKQKVKLLKNDYLVHIIYDASLILMFILSVSYVVSDSYNPFIYFRF